MQKKFECISCNYATDRHFNYNKHIQSKRHTTFSVPKKTIIIQKKAIPIPKKAIKICKFCNKQFSQSSHINRHYKICKEKNKYEKTIEETGLMDLNLKLVSKLQTITDTLYSKEKEKLEIEKLLTEKLEKELTEKLELIEHNKKLKQQTEDIKDEFMKYLLSSNDNNSTNITLQNNIGCNVYYVMKNCKDAYNYDELMEAPLTVEELEDLNNNTAVSGSINLLTNRCIKDIDFHKRPIHLLDESRKKYCVKLNDCWKIDIKGEEIMNKLINKLKDVYLLKDIDDSIIMLMNKNTKFKELFDGKNKILEYINDKVILKNNIKAMIK
jgi:hypothetical protein